MVPHSNDSFAKRRDSVGPSPATEVNTVAGKRMNARCQNMARQGVYIYAIRVSRLPGACLKLFRSWIAICILQQDRIIANVSSLYTPAFTPKRTVHLRGTVGLCWEVIWTNNLKLSSKAEDIPDFSGVLWLCLFSANCCSKILLKYIVTFSIFIWIKTQTNNHVLHFS